MKGDGSDDLIVLPMNAFVELSFSSLDVLRIKELLLWLSVVYSIEKLSSLSKMDVKPVLIEGAAASIVIWS